MINTKNNNPQLMQERMAATIMANVRNREYILRAVRRDDWYSRNAIIENDTQLTVEELKEIQEFWGPYAFAYKNKPETQRVFSRISGRFDPSYIGFGLMRYILRNWYSHSSYVLIAHKNYTGRIFPFVKKPQSIVYYSFGCYYNRDFLPIAQADAIEIVYDTLQNHQFKELILKPAGWVGEGKNILFLNKTFSKEQIENIIKGFRMDFIVQEVIVNHKSLRIVHPPSLQTFRVVTLVWKNQVKFVGAVMRMGIEKRIDNISQGGIGVEVKEDGHLGDFGTTYFGTRYYAHPTTGFVFADKQIFNFDKVVETAKLMHSTIMQQKYVSWDFTIDEKGDPVFIEINSPGGTEILQRLGINSLINKDIAREILDETLRVRFFKEGANQEYDYREFFDHISLVRYYPPHGEDLQVVVPKSINKKPVKVIYKDTFCSKNITQITIPSGIRVDQAEFSMCSPNCVINIT